MVYIVLVEDDRMLSESTKEMLECFGHICDIFCHGDQLLEEIKTGLVYDIAIIDRELPGRSGDDLVFLLKRNLPDKPIILTSGYTHPGNAPYDVFHEKGHPLIESVDFLLRTSPSLLPE